VRVRHLLVHAVSISAVLSARDALLGHPADKQGETSLARSSGRCTIDLLNDYIAAMEAKDSQRLGAYYA